jgi:hypothetical protein
VSDINWDRANRHERSDPDSECAQAVNEAANNKNHEKKICILAIVK